MVADSKPPVLTEDQEIIASAGRDGERAVAQELREARHARGEFTEAEQTVQRTTEQNALNASRQSEAQILRNQAQYYKNAEVGHSTLDSHILSVTRRATVDASGESYLKSIFKIAAGTTADDSLKLEPLKAPTLAEREAQLIKFVGEAGIAESTKTGIAPYLADADGSVLQKQRDFALRMCPDNDADGFIKGNFDEFSRGVKEYQEALKVEQAALASPAQAMPTGTQPVTQSPGAGRG